MPIDDEFLNRFRQISPDSFFVVDRERKICDFNDGLVQLIGARASSRRNLNGKPCHEALQLSICSDKCIALEALARDGNVRMQEINGTAPDGRELTLELSALPLRDEQGRVTGVLVSHRDVTDERRLKTRYEEERTAHQNEREVLLRIISEREQELQRLKG